MTDGPFVLPVEGALTVPGRGTVVTGTVQKGVLKKGEAVELVGFGNTLKSCATDLQVFGLQHTPFFHDYLSLSSLL